MTETYWLIRILYRKFTFIVNIEIILYKEASSAVDHGFEARSGQTKDYLIGYIKKLLIKPDLLNYEMPFRFNIITLRQKNNFFSVISLREQLTF
jgi:hypothetical protein